MSFSYPTVLINSIPYTVFGDVDDANVYLAANIAAANWNAIASTDETTKPQALVSATRWLDAQTWQGTLADPTQVHAFPRAGLTNLAADGATVDSTTLPALLVQATFELANAFVDDPSIQTTLQQAIAKELHAGPAGLSFFRPLNVQILSPLPKILMSLVGQWLGGQSATPVHSKGTHEKPKLDHPFDFQHGI